jgi:pimeloyl-ACP methyl ester carboxylesterase
VASRATVLDGAPSPVPPEPEEGEPVQSSTVSSVVSDDGVTIGYRSVGSGPDLVIVHGSIATGEQWAPVADLLAPRVTCHLVDRRGRGRSGDSADYALEREAADIRAVLSAIGPQAALLAHSYGAICALEALRGGGRASSVLLYEPPLPLDGPVAGDALAPFAAEVSAGRLDDALAFALTEIVHVPAEAVAGLRQAPVWPGMAALTPTWVREIAAIDGLEPGVERYAGISAPVLCLLGELTAAHHVAATRALAGVLPQLRTETLPGQEHFAHMAAPELVADVLGRALG